MLTYTYVSEGMFALMEKPKPVLQHERDAIVKVTLASTDYCISHCGNFRTNHIRYFRSIAIRTTA